MKAELIKSLSIAAILSLGAPAFAQDSTEPADTQTEAAEAAPTGPDMGTEVSEETLQPGQTYVAEKIGDWDLKCISNPNGDDPCQIYQLLKDTDGNSVAEVSLGKLPAGNQAVSGATVVVPLETLLTQQLTIGVDGGQTRRYPFRFCSQPGCVANIGFTAEEIASFKKGAKATVTIVPAAAPTQKVNLDMSLTGFTAAYDKLVEPKLPQQ
ncbi:invasion associated locus B family protein [Aliiroseovarius sp. KMU-50]|uniref:Invasion associated locus B family protein n=2 Tax=Aliiroseovarius salicola TaxID=3009082 RepID=A0ABT4W479_9RHOB|nr:invasion associated locus B family protein [Aliiroseovarius sp. KMU-50]MDA5094780.1 invasion associated locus B family protein [Aliiroseovarius sp. KMU-50]